jgi:hypothetical protein
MKCGVWEDRIQFIHNMFQICRPSLANGSDKAMLGPPGRFNPVKIGFFGFGENG